MTTSYSANREGLRIIRDAISRADEFGIKVWQADCGATLLDMGLTCPGSWKAAQAFVDASCGGLARSTFGTMMIGGYCVPTIEVWVDNPVVAVVAVQAGCWELGAGEFAEIGSGPARAAALADRWSASGYVDRAEEVVVFLQTRRIPSDELCRFVAEACHVTPNNVYVVFAPTASLVGMVQVASRTVEQAMVKLWYHGFDIHTVRHSFGTAPVAPLSLDEGEAMGRANDCLLYGGTTVLYADAPDEAIESVVRKLPMNVNAGELWGLPFKEIFARFNYNWFAVPDTVDSPARVTIHSLRSGRVFDCGEINWDVLARSFFGAFQMGEK